MFIMTNFNISNGIIEVLDTKDGMREQIFLAPLAQRMSKSSKLKIYGVRRGIESGKNLYPYPQFNLTLSPADAQQAINRLYSKNNCNV